MANNWDKLTKRQQAYARVLRDRAWKAGLEMTVSSIARDLSAAIEMIETAEREQGIRR